MKPAWREQHIFSHYCQINSYCCLIMSNQKPNTSAISSQAWKNRRAWNEKKLMTNTRWRKLLLINGKRREDVNNGEKECDSRAHPRGRTKLTHKVLWRSSKGQKFSSEAIVDGAAWMGELDLEIYRVEEPKLHLWFLAHLSAEKARQLSSTEYADENCFTPISHISQPTIRSEAGGRRKRSDSLWKGDTCCCDVNTAERVTAMACANLYPDRPAQLSTTADLKHTVRLPRWTKVKG